MEWDALLIADSANTFGLYLQLGEPDRLEIGLDAPEFQEDRHWLPNVKVQPWPEKSGRPAAAIGLLSPTDDSPGRHPYAVFSWPGGAFRGHAGLWRTDDFCAMTGVEYYRNNARSGVLLDWLSGSQGARSLGLFRALGHHWPVQLYSSHAHAAGDDFLDLTFYLEIPNVFP